MKRGFGFYFGGLIFIIVILCLIFFFTNRRNTEDSEVSEYYTGSDAIEIQETAENIDDSHTETEDERVVNAGAYGEIGTYPDQTLTGNLPDEESPRTATNIFTDQYTSYNIFAETGDEAEQVFFNAVETAVKEIYPACGEIDVITILPYKEDVYLSVVADRSGELFFLLKDDDEEISCVSVPLSDGDVMQIINDYAEVVDSE